MEVQWLEADNELSPQEDPITIHKNDATNEDDSDDQDSMPDMIPRGRLNADQLDTSDSDDESDIPDLFDPSTFTVQQTPYTRAARARTIALRTKTTIPDELEDEYQPIGPNEHYGDNSAQRPDRKLFFVYISKTPMVCPAKTTSRLSRTCV